MLIESYHPISLLPVISKVFEQLLHTRISSLLADFILRGQFAFRKEHSDDSPIHPLYNGCLVTYKLSTATVLSVVSKAFYRVWYKVLYKLAHSLIPLSTVPFLRSYLCDRTFMVSINRTCSSVCPVAAGNPLGLSSALFFT